ncbi:MAG: trypsin-like peptidase domain-containing protein [Bacteroidota bacterium]|nr:trypsin-like peptidase domain-containing protein [Bacteroidota bacterium]
MSRPKIFSTLALVAVVFVAGVLFATTGANLFDQGHRIGTDTQASNSKVLRAPSTAARLEWEEAFINVADAVNPAVVQIRSAEIERSDAPNAWDRELEWERTPLERFFFQAPRPNDFPQVRQGLGSGVLIRSDGYIVTNNHVIESADKLQVLLHDGRTFTAAVVGRDANTDLAVIRIDETDLPTVTLAPPGDVQVGQWVMAFGSPLDVALENTVTAGIVSAIGRTSARLSAINLYSDFIQTDAAINRGNSGGPLVNMSGQLIGINSAILSPTGNNAGIGFAIPVSIVDNVAMQLVEKGRVDRGFLGINFDRVSRSLANALDAPPGSAQVRQVIDNSAADKAGVRTGDIIAGIDGVELEDYLLLRTIIGNKAPGDQVLLEIIRDNNRLQLEVVLGELLDQGSQDRDSNDRQEEDPDNLDELGLQLRNLDREILQERFSLSEEIQGVWVQSINPSSTAYDEADLRANDIIVEINREPVSDRGDFRRIYRSIAPGDVFLVKVLRFQRTSETAGEFLPLMTALTKPE